MVLSVLGAYLSAYVAYQLLLVAGNTFIPEAPPVEPSRARRFNMLVPAHNEELHLPRLLASLQLQNYPTEQYQVTVVADNCTDGTARVCGKYDIDVLERVDPMRRGKGHAIGWALERIDIGRFDAVIIVDGDSVVGEGFLKHLNIQMERGDRVIQCYNGVANPGQSWFTRLMDVSRTIANEILHPGKRKLGLSSHLMGNGMCFDVETLKKLGWDALSVGEDWEYYARLVLSGGYVGFSRQARVYHQESVDLRQASSQRIRWASGRFQVLREYGTALLREGLRTRSVKCLDASLPLIFPNPSLGINLTIIGLVVSGLFSPMGADSGLLLWYAALAFAQLGLFAIGILYTKNRTANALSLALAPIFLCWKFGIDTLSAFGIGTKRWKPTPRRLS